MSDIITIENQNSLSIKGATKVSSSTQSMAVVEANDSVITISGCDLEVKKLDLENKEVAFAGKITNIKFMRASEKQSFFKRLFK